MRRVVVRVARTAGTLAVAYVLEGEIGRVRLPLPGPRCVTERLWEHTCCELFIARPGVRAYHEFNFAPSGDWAFYAFSDYRELVPPTGGATVAEPQVAVRRASARLELDALIRLDRLAYADGTLSLALAVVIEDTDGVLSYWALAHPSGAPDFHHLDAFRLTLDEARH